MPNWERVGPGIAVVGISLALAWIVQPLFGAVFWSLIAAILFMPMNDRLLTAFPGQRNSCAALTLLTIMVIAILPTILLAGFLLQELTVLCARMQQGAGPDAYFLQFRGQMPAWFRSLLAQWGLADFDAVRTKVADGIAASFQSLLTRALEIGRSAADLAVGLGVMLYLTFFLVRDGRELAAKIERSVPLDQAVRAVLLDRFSAVVRATVKGGLVVAMVQGTIGGIVFWMLGIPSAPLWGVLMSFLSLLPSVGTGIVWLPVAIFLLVTGSVWQGIAIILCGLFVIGLVDNLLRPMLVGRDAHMPDYIVLVSTLGGLHVLGFNGLVAGPLIAGLFIAVWDLVARSRAPLEPHTS